MRRTTCLALVLCIATAACADLPPITSPDTDKSTVTPPSAQTLRGYVRRADISDEAPWAWNLELRNGQLVPTTGADAMLESRENTDVVVVGTFVAGVLHVQSCSAPEDNPDGETRRGRRGR